LGGGFRCETHAARRTHNARAHVYGRYGGACVYVQGRPSEGSWWHAEGRENARVSRAYVTTGAAPSSPPYIITNTYNVVRTRTNYVEKFSRAATVEGVSAAPCERVVPVGSLPAAYHPRSFVARTGGG